MVTTEKTQNISHAPQQELHIGAIYRHYRNRKTYRVIVLGHSTVNDGEVVIYQALYNDPIFGDQHMWVRPKDEFVGYVESAGKMVLRFELVEMPGESNK